MHCNVMFIYNCHKVLIYDELATGYVYLTVVLVAVLFAS